MKIAIRLAQVVALAALGYWLWTVFFPNPEKVVLKRIASLASTATIKAGDGAIVRAAKVSSVIGYFATDAEIQFDTPEVGSRTVTGRDEIREIAAGGFANVHSLSVKFDDATARVAPDKLSADVSCTARVTPGDSKDIGLQELRFKLKKIDGDWLITRVETVKTLQ
jgi:hypothetical protein